MITRYKKLVYIVETFGLTTTRNRIANEDDKTITVSQFEFLQIKNFNNRSFPSIDLLILEDEVRFQIEIIKISRKINEFKTVVVCDNLTVMSDLLNELQDYPKIIMLDYRIGSTSSIGELPNIYKKIKSKFAESAVLAYTQFGKLTGYTDFSGNTELTNLIHENRDAVYDKSLVNSAALEAILYDRLEVSRLRKEIKELRILNNGDGIILGNSKAIQTILQMIDKVAPLDTRVLITGENGTGKELVARAIHKKSLRKDKAFVEVNCAAIPNELIESELFGHEKGSFTGAVQQRIGRFELANKGTLFLDEVGDMSHQTQAKVLRAIEDGKIERVGGGKKIDVDVRLISATNKNLKEEIEKGNFREDLYHRLNVFPINVPPLRERLEDIQILIEHFINIIAAKHKKSVITFNDDAISLMQGLPWKGNVRELCNTIERIMILIVKKEIKESDIVSLLGLPHEGVKNNDSLLIHKNINDKECSETEKFLDKIQAILFEYFSDQKSVNENAFITKFKSTSEGIYLKQRTYFTKKELNPRKACIKILLNDQPTRWKVVREKCQFIRCIVKD